MKRELFPEEIGKIAKRRPNKIILSNPRIKKDDGYNKIVFNRIILKGRECYQIEKYTERQVFHHNIEENELADEIIALSEKYKQINIFSFDFDAEIKFNKIMDFMLKIKEKGNSVNVKDNASLSQNSNQNSCLSSGQSECQRMLPVGNNRRKNYVLSEGMDIPVFVELGIFTSELKVVNSKYDKFKQINRFVEILSDAIKGYPKKSINIIDFGCGKSYLTFIVYYYLTEVKGIDVNIIGLDLKADVIEKCNKLSDKFGYKNLRFELGDINGYAAPFEVDMVMTLHACDTATDYALYNAISWGAEIILSVPCCQHEINKQIKSERLSAVTKYGIIKERVSALITDAVRGSLLEYSGYKTDVMEFVDIEHSPKNIMIRARKGDISLGKREKALNEARQLLDEFGSEQTLCSLLAGNKKPEIFNRKIK